MLGRKNPGCVKPGTEQKILKSFSCRHQIFLYRIMARSEMVVHLVRFFVVNCHQAVLQVVLTIAAGSRKFYASGPRLSFRTTKTRSGPHLTCQTEPVNVGFRVISGRHARIAAQHYSSSARRASNQETSFGSAALSGEFCISREMIAWPNVKAVLASALAPC